MCGILSTLVSPSLYCIFTVSVTFQATLFKICKREELIEHGSHFAIPTSDLSSLSGSS